MKILLATLDWPADFGQSGGIGNYYCQLRDKSPQNIKIDVFNPISTQGGAIKTKFYEKNIWPHWEPLFNQMLKLVTAKAYDYYWAGQIWPVGLVLYFLSLYFPKKCQYFISCHGLDIQIIKKNWLKKIIAKKILKRAHLVTANSEFTKKLIKELSPSVNCLVIYPAANELPKAEKTAQEQLSTQYQLTDKPILLSVSRLVKRKGQDLIIKSLPKLWQKFPNLIYVCIGSGPEQNQLQNLTTQTPRSNQIIFLNQVTDQELTNWYSLATLFVLPVYQDINDPEGFGMVYLEANSFGLPVIGSQTGGIPEAINNGYSGLLIKPGDASELTKSIDLLLSNEDLFKKIQQQAPLWAKKFNWTQGATLFYSALNRL